MCIRDRGYNCQAAADCVSQVIVAKDVTQQENDVQQLIPMLNQVEEQAGDPPEVLLADAGYWSDANAALEGGTELFIATSKDWKQRKTQRDNTATGPLPEGHCQREHPCVSRWSTNSGPNEVRAR